MNSKSLLLKACMVALLVLLPTLAAQADPVLIVNNPRQVGVPGGALSFFGSITNNGSTAIQIGGSTSPFDPITAFLRSPTNLFFVDTERFTFNPIYNFTTGITLAPGASTGRILLFDIFIGSNAVFAGPFFGSVFVTDRNGIDSNEVTFEVTTVPEPATMVLLGTGLAGIYATRRRRQSRSLEADSTELG